MNPIDPNMHRTEFRLRLLITNECYMSCSYCLNDFQKKGNDYLDSVIAFDVIVAYANFMNEKKETGIVTFSGGEPGLYPHLNQLAMKAKDYNLITKVATYGMAINKSMIDYVDYYHWHVEHERSIPEWLSTKKLVVQIVVTESMKGSKLDSLVKHYLDQKVKVKLFEDFNSNDLSLSAEVASICYKYEGMGVYSRFTGLQVNRGTLCSGCKNKCITLKGLWVFPDGSASGCPQGIKGPIQEVSWTKIIEKAYIGHLWKGDKDGH